ncbi:MAG: hypothetical protein JWO06_3980, partial [Bacteroidota bacterium]|nr:hypothetical protein [Bacteroidota bacterium]
IRPMHLFPRLVNVVPYFKQKTDLNDQVGLIVN